MKSAIAFVAMLYLLSSCGYDIQNSAAGSQEDFLLRWKGVLLAGDSSIRAFDNARDSMKDYYQEKGLLDFHLKELSATSSEQGNGVLPASVSNFEQAFEDLAPGPANGCTVYMTSHGTRDHFYLQGQNGLTPTKFDQILNQYCPDQPTVLLISACYSGIFSEPIMQRPNRIILTAARKDRTSFGCSPENEYTYWDGCLLSNIKQATSWRGLHQNISTCIRNKEGQGGFTPSEPQAFFGSQAIDQIFPRTI